MGNFILIDERIGWNVAKKTKAEALETRSAILDAAEEVFERDGVSKASLEEIASSAGVSRGAVYWYFKNKTDLLDAVIRRVCDILDSGVAEVEARQPANALDGLRIRALQVLSQIANNSQCQRVLKIAWHQCEYVGDMARVRDTHLGRGNLFISIHEDAIRDCCRQGLLPESLCSRRAAVSLMGLVYGLAATWMLDPESFPLDEYGAWAIDNYLCGLQHAKV